MYFTLQLCFNQPDVNNPTFVLNLPTNDKNIPVHSIRIVNAAKTVLEQNMRMEFNLAPEVQIYWQWDDTVQDPNHALFRPHCPRDTVSPNLYKVVLIVTRAAGAIE